MMNITTNRKALVAANIINIHSTRPRCSKGTVTTCQLGIVRWHTLDPYSWSTLYKARTPMATTRAPLTKPPAAAPVAWTGADEAARLTLEAAAAAVPLEAGRVILEAAADWLIIMEDDLAALAAMELMGAAEVPAAADEAAAALALARG
jgi:hypothetical protein